MTLSVLAWTASLVAQPYILCVAVNIVNVLAAWKFHVRWLHVLIRPGIEISFLGNDQLAESPSVRCVVHIGAAMHIPSSGRGSSRAVITYSHVCTCSLSACCYIHFFALAK